MKCHKNVITLPLSLVHPALPLHPCKHIRTCTHLHVRVCLCVMECGTSLLFVAFGCPLCVEQQGGSYNPITVVVMKDQRPRLEVRHFWHPLTLLHYQSQQLLSQAAHCAEYRKSYTN